MDIDTDTERDRIYTNRYVEFLKLYDTTQYIFIYIYINVIKTGPDIEPVEVVVQGSMVQPGSDRLYIN